MNIKSIRNFELLLSKVFNAVITIFESVITSLFVPLVLIGTIVAEFFGVKAGIQTVGKDALVTNVLSLVIVVSLAFLEIYKIRIEHEAGYDARKFYKGSLRTWVTDVMLYRLGLIPEQFPGTKNPNGKVWEKKPISPAHDIHQLVNFVSWGIVLISGFGRAWPILQGIEGTWVTSIFVFLGNGTVSEVVPVLLMMIVTAISVLLARQSAMIVGYRSIQLREQFDSEIHEQLVHETELETAVAKAQPIKVAKVVNSLEVGGSKASYVDAAKNLVYEAKKLAEDSYVLAKFEGTKLVGERVFKTPEALQEQGLREVYSDLRKWKLTQAA